jgi:hypothetical protein
MISIRIAAWCGVLGAVCIAVPGVVEAFTGETGATSFALGVSPALALPVLVALHLRQHDVAGSFGSVAFTVNVVGLGLFGGAAFTLNLALFYLDQPVVDDLLAGPTMSALLGSALVFVVGTALFGIAMVRAGVHPRLPAAAYVVTMPMLAIAARLPDSALTSAIHVAAGATLGWLAVTLTAGNQMRTGPRSGVIEA